MSYRLIWLRNKKAVLAKVSRCENPLFCLDAFCPLFIHTHKHETEFLGSVRQTDKPSGTKLSLLHIYYCKGIRYGFLCRPFSIRKSRGVLYT